MTSDKKERFGRDIITKSELRISKMQICSGVFQNFLESIQPELVKTIALCKPGSFEDCSQCASSGSDAWESFCNVIKNSNLKHIKCLQINKNHFNANDISSLMESLQNRRSLRTLQIPGSKISHEGLIHLRNNLPVNARANIARFNRVTLVTSVHNDNQVHVDIESLLYTQDYELSDDHMQGALSEDLITALLEGDLPPELNGITVTTESFVSKALLRSVGNSKMVTTFKVVGLNDEKFTKYAGDFRDMLANTKTLQTLKLISCKLNDTSIKYLEDGLSHNEAVALKLDDESKEAMRHLSEIVTTCKQLRVLKVRLEDDPDIFFQALTDNQNLRELSIRTTGKMMVLLFQTLPSTSITTLDLSKLYRSEGLGNEGSLVFRDFIHRNKVLTVLKANECGLTDEAFKGITFTNESPLRELSLRENDNVDKGWTELFHGLCSSCITTLDVSVNSLYEEKCYTALKCLLINNKTLTVLRVGNYMSEANDDIVCCIADALSQKCSLRELTICGYTQTMQGWINLFESLYENTTLNTLNCSDAQLAKHKSNNEVAKSVCEMLQHNQGIKNLNISDKLIEGHLKEFAMAYIQRKPVLNLTVGKFEEQLVNEIEQLETDTDNEYNINSDINVY